MRRGGGWRRRRRRRRRRRSWKMSGTVLEHVAFLFEPKLRTKMNQPPVRGGVELQASRDHVGGRGRAQ